MGYQEITAIWTTLGEQLNMIIVFALLMMLAIGLVSRKNNQISALIYWQTLFQLFSLSLLSLLVMEQDIQ